MDESCIQAPVLFIVFNRPEKAQRVFEIIKSIKPKKLYVAADGPRMNNPSDIDNCKKVREIVSHIDWECNARFLFHDKNLGCGYGPASAISWAFENEDSLVILEDDCVPSISFFDFCNYCLAKYANDERVWIVSGRSHHENSKYFLNQDYIFSHYGHTWGWATWKRCWNHFDIDMKKWPEFIKMGGFLNSFYSMEEGKYHNKFYSKLYHEKNLSGHVWDYQHVLGIHMNGGISIIPSKNLVQNIGSTGTHSAIEMECHKLKASEDFTIEKEPLFVLANREYDLFHFRNHINPHISIFKRALNKIHSILN